MTQLMQPLLVLEEYTPLPSLPVPAHREKGLHNFVGQNNCFLNVNIQALWHLEGWRKRFLAFEKEHVHADVNTCIFCALKSILTEYSFGDTAHLPPTSLRLALSILYKDLERFQIGKIDDASEALEAILSCLHGNLRGEVAHAHEPGPGKFCNPPCLAHDVFGLDVIEQEGCKEMCGIYRYLSKAPEVFTIGLVWESANSTGDEVGAILDQISVGLDLSHIFTMTKTHYMYRFRGMICYYGLHYSAFFFNAQQSRWFSFDDINVREVGSDWAAIREKCVRGRMQPSVLFYERDHTHPSLPVAPAMLRANLSRAAQAGPEAAAPTTSAPDDTPKAAGVASTCTSTAAAAAHSATGPLVPPSAPATDASPSVCAGPQAAAAAPAPVPLVQSGDGSGEGPAKAVASSAGVSGGEDSGDEFVLVRPDPMFETRERNWLARTQVKFYRFSPTHLQKLAWDGVTLELSWPYEEMLEIRRMGAGTRLLISFRQATSVGINYAQVDEMIAVLQARRLSLGQPALLVLEA